jgi:hypothetical protein
MDDCRSKDTHYSYRGKVFHIFNIKDYDKKFIEESYDTLFDLVELFGFRFIRDNFYTGGLRVARNEVIISFLGTRYSIYEEKDIALKLYAWTHFNTRYELFEYLNKKYPTFYQPNLKLAIHET